MATPIIKASTNVRPRAKAVKMEQHFACEYDHVRRLAPITGDPEYEGPGDITTEKPLEIIAYTVSIEQKGRTIHSGALRAIDAYILGSVPRQKFSKNPVDTISDARDLGLLNYQRPLASKKRENLSSWFSQGGMNYLATSALLWLPELETAANSATRDRLVGQGKGVLYEESGLGTNFNGCINQITIPIIDDSLKSPGDVCVGVKRVCNEGGHTDFQLINNNWFDYCPDCGWNGKPAEIIDGQHRISGSGLSVNSTELIPCTFTLGDQFDAQEKAKMFSEVTVEATSLHDLHAMNLVYRSRPSRDHKKMKFRTEPTRGMLYNAAIEVTRGGPLQNRIYIVPNEKGNKPKGSMAKIEQMTNWMFDSELISAVDGVNSSGWASMTRIAELVRNWFEAIELSAGIGWAGGATWSRSRGGRGSPMGTLNGTPPTEVFVKLLPTIIRHYGISGIVSVADFQIASNYISRIDLQDYSSFRTMSGGTGGQDNIKNIVHLLGSMISDITVTGATVTPPLPPATAAPWITSFPSRTVEAFSVSAILPSPGTLIGPTNILSIQIDVTSHDLVNTMPKGPLNSLHRNPNLKITDASGNIYFDEELGVKAVSKTFDTPLTDDTTGYTATAGDVLTVEVTYLHITSGPPPRTESTTITL